jgi:translation initiation factor 3 subunit L
LWNIHSVLNVLYSLVDKSNINQQLEVRSRESLLVVI